VTAHIFTCLNMERISAMLGVMIRLLSGTTNAAPQLAEKKRKIEGIDKALPPLSKRRPIEHSPTTPPLPPETTPTDTKTAVEFGTDRKIWQHRSVTFCRPLTPLQLRHNYVPTGLINDHNYCFINTAFQCFFACPDFNRLILEPTDATTIPQAYIEPTQSSEQLDTIIDEIRKLYKRLQSESTAFKATNMYEAMVLAGFNVKDQDDMGVLVDKFLVIFANKRPSLFRMFAFVEFKRLECPTCHVVNKYIYYNEKNIYQPALVIDPTQEQYKSARNALDTMVRTGSKEYCANTVAHRDVAAPKLDAYRIIATLPSILIIRTSTRVDDFAVSPQINPSKFAQMKEAYALQPKMKYVCFAIACHIGHTEAFGHYVALVRTQEGWFLCDDRTVSYFKEIPIRSGTFGGVLQPVFDLDKIRKSLTPIVCMYLLQSTGY